MGGACNRHGLETYTWFRWENLRERDRLEATGIDWRVILKWIFRKWDGGGGKDWIDLTEVRDRQLALVNAAMNFVCVPRFHISGY
jgi:hypothetical protein